MADEMLLKIQLALACLMFTIDTALLFVMRLWIVCRYYWYLQEKQL